MQELLKLEERLRLQISEDIYPLLDIVSDYDLVYFRYKVLVLKKDTSKIWFKFIIDPFDYKGVLEQIKKIAEVINERAEDFLLDRLIPITTQCSFLGVSIIDPKEGRAIVNGKEIKSKPGDIITYKGDGVYMWNGDCWYQYEIDTTPKVEITATASYSYPDRAPKPMKCECCGAIMESPYQCDYCGTKYFFN